MVHYIFSSLEHLRPVKSAKKMFPNKVGVEEIKPQKDFQSKRYINQKDSIFELKTGQLIKIKSDSNINTTPLTKVNFIPSTIYFHYRKEHIQEETQENHPN